jgi:hypothetical protein
MSTGLRNRLVERQASGRECGSDSPDKWTIGRAIVFFKRTERVTAMRNRLQEERQVY